MIDQFPELLLFKNCSVIGHFFNQIYRPDSFFSNSKLIPNLFFFFVINTKYQCRSRGEGRLIYIYILIIIINYYIDFKLFGQPPTQALLAGVAREEKSLGTRLIIYVRFWYVKFFVSWFSEINQCFFSEITQFVSLKLPSFKTCKVLEECLVQQALVLHLGLVLLPLQLVGRHQVKFDKYLAIHVSFIYKL